METANDFGTGRSRDAQAGVAEGDAAIWIDTGVGTLAPDMALGETLPGLHPETSTARVLGEKAGILQ